jgi:uncharacterized protein
VAVHEISRADARRIAVRAQLLGGQRPTGLLELVRGLTLVQIDQSAAIAPGADLLAWSRLGSPYSGAELDAALADRKLIELRGMIRPAEDLALYRAEMAEWASGEVSSSWQGALGWVKANDAFRRDILARLRADGPLPARELPDTACAVPWRSTGWNNNRNTGQMIELLERRGEVAVSGRSGRDRLWDLAERVYPDGPAVRAAEASGHRNEKRLRALGIARAHGPDCAVEPLGVGQAGEPAIIEGVRGTWRVDPESLGQPFAGRTALLSPFDRLIYDRKRMTDIFGFDYQVEMFKPAARRRWGYYALPILHGDRLVGKVDAITDRRAGVLQVNAIHQDEPFSKTLAAAVEQEIRELADWVGRELSLAA